MEQNKKHIDHDFFEFIIALNITINEAYLVSVIDVIDLNYIKNPDIQKYSKIIIDFYHTRNKTPNATEIKAYLVSDELKTAYKNVVSKFKQLDTEYDYDELICNTEQYLKEKAMYGAVLQTVEKFSKENATIVVTHYQRLLNYIIPDRVHVMKEGRLVKSGGKELALELEERGYDWVREEIEQTV